MAEASFADQPELVVSVMITGGGGAEGLLAGGIQVKLVLMSPVQALEPLKDWVVPG